MLQTSILGAGEANPTIWQQQRFEQPNQGLKISSGHVRVETGEPVGGARASCT
jgi:hypothetical protein